MTGRDLGFSYKQRVKRRKIIRIIFVVAFFLMVISGFFLFRGRDGGSDHKSLVQCWRSGSYSEAFRLSEIELQKKPIDFFLLMVHGFSAYQLSHAQINSADTISYIDRSIWALRKALHTKQGEKDPRIRYVLGQAYFYKGAPYADLCIKYLEEARAASYKAADIPEFLGLAYASIHDYRSSVEAFSEALETDEPSDLLLLAIARSYIELDESAKARSYILRALEVSKDFNAIAQARLILSNIMMKDGDLQEAESQILSVISEGGDTAEAHFQLGELYNARFQAKNDQNDSYRARSEWRKAWRLDPAFAPARLRLNM
jgi:tetratricopeptide (TPR) repeat protein